jgi:DNA-binding CsgD family transcriptional regulator
MRHPFHEAGFGVGTVIRACSRVNDHISISFDIYRAQSHTNPMDCAMIDGVAHFIVQSLRSFVAEKASVAWLSARESDVLDLVAVGYSVNEIAEHLDRSPHTVHDHLKAIHRKTGATSRGQLIAAATGRRAVTSLARQS